MTIGGLVAIVADLLDGAALPDAGQHVGENMAARGVIQHIAGGDGGDPGGVGLLGGLECRRTASLGRRRMVKREIGAVGEAGFQASQVFAGVGSANKARR